MCQNALWPQGKRKEKKKSKVAVTCTIKHLQNICETFATFFANVLA